MDAAWYYVSKGAQTGPVSFTDLKDAAAAGKFGPDDLVWQEGTADWVPGRTVAGLFPSVPAAPPPPVRSAVAPATYGVEPTSPPSRPAPGPLPLEPEPLPIDDEPSRGGRGGRGGRLRDEGPPPGMPEWMQLAHTFLRRAFNVNAAETSPTTAEATALTRAGVMDVTARKFAVWRRAVLLVAAGPCALAALFALIDVIAMKKEDREVYTPFGMFVLYIRALALFALPAAAIVGGLLYDRLNQSTKWVLIGGLVAFAVPIVTAFTPTEWLLEIPDDKQMTVSQAGAMRTLFGMVMGIQFYIWIAPLALSILPAVARACIRLKLLLPESIVPGWGLVTSIPVFVVLALTAFIVVYHAAGNGFLLLGLLLWIGAPLLYLLRFNELVRPGTAASRAALARLAYGVLGLIGLGSLFLLIYALTTKITLPGSDPAPVLGFDDKAILRPWSLTIHKFWIEYLGRSLFMTVFFGDILLRIVLSVWKEEKAFVGSPAAEGFDRTTAALGAAVAPALGGAVPERSRARDDRDDPLAD